MEERDQKEESWEAPCIIIITLKKHKIYLDRLKVLLSFLNYEVNMNSPKNWAWEKKRGPFILY